MLDRRRVQAHGEKAVRAVAPGATIVRPADVFGAEDRFLNLFARMYQVGLAVEVGSGRVAAAGVSWMIVSRDVM